MIYKYLPIALFFTLLSCGADTSQDDSRILAKVGSASFTEQNLLHQLPSFNTESDSTYFAQAIISQWIERQVFSKKAIELNIDKTEEFNARYELLREQLLSELLVDYVILNQQSVSVSRDEVMQFYNQHRSSIVLPERYLQFHHMITQSLEDAEQARSELFMGLDWEEIAHRYSIDPDYSISNSRIFHPESTVLKDLPIKQQFARLIGITEVSPTRLIDGNYHFIQLIDDRAPGDIPDLEWALDLVEEWLLIDKRQQFFDTYKRNLLREATTNGLVQTFF